MDTTTFSRRRKIVTAALVILGRAACCRRRIGAAIGFGALVLFVGRDRRGPVHRHGGARLARPLLSRFGLEGRLAVDNTARNPQRTATTANALLIGVFLVTLVTAAGTSVKDFAVGEIKKLDSADYIITSDGGSIDPALQADFKNIDGVKTVTPFRRESVTIDGDVTRLSSGDVPAMQKIADLQFARGSNTDIRPGTIAVLDTEAPAARRDGQGGRQRRALDALARVGAADADARRVAGRRAHRRETFDDLVGNTAPTVAFMDVDSGAQTKTEDAIQARADTRPDITVDAGNAIGKLARRSSTS